MSRMWSGLVNRWRERSVAYQSGEPLAGRIPTRWAAAVLVLLLLAGAIFVLISLASFPSINQFG